MDPKIVEPLISYSYVVPLLTGVFALISGIYGTPRLREKEIEQQRPDLLERLEYDLARDVANVIPIRSEGIEDEDYLETCRTRLRDKMPAGIGSMCLEYFESEQCFKSFIRRTRLFTRGVGAVFLFELALFMCSIAHLSALFQWVIVVLAFVGAAATVFLITLATAMGDRYQDYLNKYKICERDHKK